MIAYIFLARIQIKIFWEYLKFTISFYLYKPKKPINWV